MAGRRARIGVQTWGSDGDIRPMLALAGGLRAAGHEVTAIVTSVDDRDYGPLCGALGVRYVRAPERTNCDLHGMLDRLGRRRAAVRMLRRLMAEIFDPYVEDIYAAARDLCCESDAVVGHFALHPVRLAAEKAGVPYASVVYWPGLVPTAERPPEGLPNLGRTANRAAWAAADWVIGRYFGKDAAALWRREGVPPPGRMFGGIWGAARLNLLAFSPALCPPASDWAPLYRPCGFFEVPLAAEPWEPSAALEDFLAAGPPPVYMTFGTPLLLDVEPFTDLLAAAARLTGRRTIIQTASVRHPPDSRAGDVFFIGRTPHHAIFPRCAAVVHHAGAGTTHSATRCGRPSVVVAFSEEQMAWGRVLQRAGVAGRPLRVFDTTPETLAARVLEAVDSAPLRDRAATLGETMRRERGVERAVAAVEEMLE